MWLNIKEIPLIVIGVKGHKMLSFTSSIMKVPIQQSDYFISSYDKYADEIFRFIRSKTRNRDTALDITQETFIRIWSSIGNGTQIENIRAFLYKTARNLIIDNFRKHHEESLEVLIDEGHEFSNNEYESIEHKSEIGIALRILDNIKPEYRDIIVMRHIDGLSIAEIAELLDIEPNTVSVRLGRALKYVQQLISGGIKKD